MTSFIVDASWLIPFYGLIGSLLTLPWALGLWRNAGPRLAAYVNLVMTLGSVIHATALFNQVLSTTVPASLVFRWVHLQDLDISLALRLTPISAAAVVTVASLSFIAQMFALGYLEKDWSLARFFALMGFFEAAMCGLALSDSLFLSYALLEMLTLSTYLLVGFWYAQPLVITAARDAFWTKRAGDLLLFMGVVSLAAIAGSLQFSDLEAWAATANLSPLTATLLGLALIAGPTGKCAQFPLHLWLDEAMEAPNPASALRNSVVVASGAYILIQLQPVLALSPIASDVVIVIGTLTAVAESLVAIAQIDVKRALSHSTSAFLGLVFIAVGLQHSEVALVLLLSHSFAKALLFMSVGAVTATINTQDLTEMGGLGGRMPASALSFVVGAWGTIALLPLGGAWALGRWLDVLVEPWTIALVMFVNAVTAFGLARVYCLMFAGKPQIKTRRAPEVPWPMAVPMITLMILVLILPWFLIHYDLVFWDWPLLSSLSLAGVLGAGTSIGIYGAGWLKRPIAMPLHEWFAYDFYIDRLYRGTIVLAIQSVSRLVGWVDRYIVDGFVNIVGLATILSGESLKYSNAGQSQLYILTFMITVSLGGLFLAWLLWFQTV